MFIFFNSFAAKGASVSGLSFLFCLERGEMEVGKNWKDPKVLAKVKRDIDEYFKSCEGELVFNADGTPYMFRGEIIRKNYKIPSMAGLALALGFNSKDVITKMISHYQPSIEDTSENIGTILLNARLRLEEANVQASMSNTSFKGSNLQLISLFGYTDKAVSQIEVTNKNPNQISKADAVKALKELGLTADAKVIPMEAKVREKKREKASDIECMKMAEAEAVAKVVGEEDE